MEEQIEQVAVAAAAAMTSAAVVTETLAMTAAAETEAVGDASGHLVDAAHAAVVGEKRKRDDELASEQLASVQQQQQQQQFVSEQLASAQQQQFASEQLAIAQQQQQQQQQQQFASEQQQQQQQFVSDQQQHQQFVSAHQQLVGMTENATAGLSLRDESPHALGLKRDDSLHQLDALPQLVPLAQVSGADASETDVDAANAQAKREDTSVTAAAPEPPTKRQYSFIPDGIKERAIVLVLQHKCSVSDVAEVMGVSRGALYKHIERARKQVDDAARARSKGDRRHVSPAAAAMAALKPDAQQSAQMKALVAKLKTSVQKSAPPTAAAVPRSNSLDAVSAANAAAMAAAANGASSVVL